MLSPICMVQDIPTLPEGREDLTGCLQQIWHHYFSDVPRANTVYIEYCYPWKSRLGMIRLSLDNTTSFIGINTLLQLPQVPEYVLLTTIAHELVHYTHGFGSPLPRRCKHPHANNVVDRELEERALGDPLRACNEWIDKNWYSFYDMQRATGWAELPGKVGRRVQASTVKTYRTHKSRNSMQLNGITAGVCQAKPVSESAQLLRI